MIKLCSKCGKRFDGDFKFCPHCGGALEIDPLWYDQQVALEKQAKAQAERERRAAEAKAALQERMDKIQALLDKIPVSSIYIDGHRLEKNYRYFDDFCRKYGYSFEEGMRKLEEHADMFSGKSYVDLYALKQDLRNEEGSLRAAYDEKVEKEEYCGERSPYSFGTFANEYFRRFIGGGKFSIPFGKEYYKEIGTREPDTYIFTDFMGREEKRYSSKEYHVNAALSRDYLEADFGRSLGDRAIAALGYSGGAEALKRYIAIKEEIAKMEQCIREGHLIESEARGGNMFPLLGAKKFEYVTKSNPTRRYHVRNGNYQTR